MLNTRCCLRCHVYDVLPSLPFWHPHHPILSCIRLPLLCGLVCSAPAGSCKACCGVHVLPLLPPHSLVLTSTSYTAFVNCCGTASIRLRPGSRRVVLREGGLAPCTYVWFMVMMMREDLVFGRFGQEDCFILRCTAAGCVGCFAVALVTLVRAWALGISDLRC
jgi:hypothetical protein